MTHTSTEQPSDQFMQIWQAYCDKKSECEDLRERIAELEAIRKAACKAHNTWAYADDTYGEVTKAMHALADAINGITQEKHHGE